MQITDSGAKSWVFRFQLNKKRREMGLGSASIITLQEARAKSLEARRTVAAGIDPIAARKPETVATWGEWVTMFIDAHKSGWRNDRQAEQWKQSLEDYGPKKDTHPGKVDTEMVLACMNKPMGESTFWKSKTETATRVRARIERVWDMAKVGKAVTGENPARWRGHLDKMLPKPSKVRKTRHFAAMPYSELPGFMADIRARKGVGYKMMRLVILTCLRTSETLGVCPGELDIDARIWIVPGERMKAGKPHTVPLNQEAIDILAGLRMPVELDPETMLHLLQHKLHKPYTIHGFRSSFRDWGSETTTHQNEVLEMALAHTIPNKVEAAYRRGELLEKRRSLMDDWGDYLR